jgi:hypothetical protein
VIITDFVGAVIVVDNNLSIDLTYRSATLT